MTEMPRKNAFARPDTLSLASVREWIASNYSIETQRRRDLASALETFSEWCGLPLDLIPADREQPEPIRRFLDAADARGEPHIDVGLPQLSQQHVDDLLRRAVAEKLAQRLLVVGDAVPLHQRDEILRRIPAQGRDTEVRVLRQEVPRRRMDIGEIAASATRDEDLVPKACVVFEHADTPATLASLQ